MVGVRMVGVRIAIAVCGSRFSGDPAAAGWALASTLSPLKRLPQGASHRGLSYGASHRGLPRGALTGAPTRCGAGLEHLALAAAEGQDFGGVGLDDEAERLTGLVEEDRAVPQQLVGDREGAFNRRGQRRFHLPALGQG
ncbi:hypothetical protein C8J98_103425 [Luteibacter sp. OK325]|nr:hypothetical protein C8J98_103425 [Luteibacter sp. OK325]